MKIFTSFLISLLFILSTLYGYAQFLQPVEKKMNIDEKVTPAWVLLVDEPEEALEESIEDYTKDELGVKFRNGKKGLLIAKEVRVPSISSYSGDLKVLLSRVNDQTQLAVAFMPGYDIALNSEEYPDEMARLRQYTRNMVKYHIVNELQEAIEDDEKRLRNLEASLKRNEREYRKLDRKSEKLQKRIDSDKTDDNEKFDMGNEREAAEDRMNTLIGEKDELDDEIAKMNEKIHGSQEEINDIERQFVEKEATVSTENEESDSENQKK